jgi:CRP/FNR family nitrogen fixation transcriptional regulator
MQGFSASITSQSFKAPAAGHARAFHRPRAIHFHAADSEIYAQGEQAGALYRIEFGAVRVYRLLSDGRRQVVAFHIAGETFGFEAWTVRSFFAETIVPTGLVAVDAEPDGRYSADLMALALRSMVRAQEHLLVIGRQSAVEKVAAFLVDLDERQGGCGLIDLPMTRTDMGDYLGMTIETASRSLSKLRDMGILRLKSTRCVEILRLEKLRQLSA